MELFYQGCPGCICEKALLVKGNSWKPHKSKCTYAAKPLIVVHPISQMSIDLLLPEVSEESKCNTAIVKYPAFMPVNMKGAKPVTVTEEGGH